MAGHGLTEGTTDQSEPGTTRAPESTSSRTGQTRLITSSPTAWVVMSSLVGLGAHK